MGISTEEQQSTFICYPFLCIKKKKWEGRGRGREGRRGEGKEWGYHVFKNCFRPLDKLQDI
jgi:hypothetical protein